VDPVLKQVEIHSILPQLKSHEIDENVRTYLSNIAIVTCIIEIHLSRYLSLPESDIVNASPLPEIVNESDIVNESLFSEN
jgi:hypothetical protein